VLDVQVPSKPFEGQCGLPTGFAQRSGRQGEPVGVAEQPCLSRPWFLGTGTLTADGLLPVEAVSTEQRAGWVDDAFGSIRRLAGRAPAIRPRLDSCDEESIHHLHNSRSAHVRVPKNLQRPASTARIHTAHGLGHAKLKRTSGKNARTPESHPRPPSWTTRIRSKPASALASLPADFQSARTLTLMSARI
jgi:hypothetical protein